MPLTERHVTPSILSADFTNLIGQVREVMDAGARVIHCDVMDGHFVPPITFGPIVVGALREALPDDAYLDVHLMIEQPERQVEEFAKAGANGITIHAEATPHLDFTLASIREAGCKAGLVVCPGTPADFFDYLDVDLGLIMTVNPGWGGQPFLRSQLDKIRRVREIVGDDVAVEVDGGVNAETAAECAEAGASWFVAGSAIFGSDDPAATYREIAEAAGCKP
ncbi:MAG TPA: ribulose-phosphate 3-epimerase [Solirubrobacteraceae bacterium]|jgi:ribulose-phosphate 3-epimerase|nr:ribulose-phosphate 3-epimerase [Solirubrobacteraceae bacterium]